MTNLLAALRELAAIGRDEFRTAYHRRRLMHHADGIAAARERQRLRVQRWTGRE